MSNDNQSAVVALKHLFQVHGLERFHVKDDFHDELVRLAGKTQDSHPGLFPERSPPELVESLTPHPHTLSPPPHLDSQRMESSPSSVFAGGDKQQPNGVAANVSPLPPAKRRKETRFWTNERIIESRMPLPESLPHPFPLVTAPTNETEEPTTCDDGVLRRLLTDYPILNYPILGDDMLII